MTRIEGRGEDLGAALADAIAQLVDADPTDVVVEVRTPANATFAGRLSIELDIASASNDVDDEDVDDEVDDEGVLDGVGDEDEVTDLDRPGDVDDPSGPDDGDDDTDDAQGRAYVTAEDLEEEAEAAADFLEGLLDALDLPGDLRIRVLDDHAEVEIVEVGNGALIGRRGQTLEAIQELVRCTLQRQFQRRSRVQVDIEGYRARRLEKLLEKADEAIDQVLDTGEPERLEPMDVFERKAVHQLVASVDGVQSRSQGREPGRRVVIEPVD